MQNQKENQSILDYFSHENPFLFLTSPQIDPLIIQRLEAMKKIQPQFVNMGIGIDTMCRERICIMRSAIEHRIKELILQGVKVLEQKRVECNFKAMGYMDLENKLREHINDQDVFEIIYQIKALKTCIKQYILRKKTFEAIKQHFTIDTFSGMDLKRAPCTDQVSEAVDLYDQLQTVKSGTTTEVTSDDTTS